MWDEAGFNSIGMLRECVWSKNRLFSKIVPHRSCERTMGGHFGNNTEMI